MDVDEDCRVGVQARERIQNGRPNSSAGRVLRNPRGGTESARGAGPARGGGAGADRERAGAGPAGTESPRGRGRRGPIARVGGAGARGTPGSSPAAILLPRSRLVPGSERFGP